MVAIRRSLLQKTCKHIFIIYYKDGSKALRFSIAKSVHVRVPKKLFKSYDFPLLYIPVYHEGLHVAHWQRDNLAEWCVLEANYSVINTLIYYKFNNFLQNYANLGKFKWIKI